MLSVRLVERIGDVDSASWDGLGGDPLSRHAVLSVLERAALPGVRIWYALVEDGTGPVTAAAPIFRIEVDGRRLTRGPFRALIGAVRRWNPRFLQTSLMVCGTPLSVANPPVRFGERTDRVAVLRALASTLDRLGDAHGAPWRVFKELGAGDLPAARAALCAGARPWMIAPSEPNSVVDVEWASFDDYLRSLRSHYRYKIRAAERKLVRAGGTIDVVPLAGAYDSTLHALYDAVAKRAAVRLEQLTARFFVELGTALGDGARLILFRRSGRVLGWVAVVLADGTAYDLFHGIDYGANESTALYFNQLAAVLRLAIARGARRVSLGQSTEVAKARFGADAVPLWIGLRHRSRIVQATFRGAQDALFPAKPIPERHVFAREPGGPDR